MRSLLVFVVAVFSIVLTVESLSHGHDHNNGHHMSRRSTSYEKQNLNYGQVNRQLVDKVSDSSDNYQPQASSSYGNTKMKHIYTHQQKYETDKNGCNYGDRRCDHKVSSYRPNSYRQSNYRNKKTSYRKPRPSYRKQMSYHKVKASY